MSEVEYTSFLGVPVKGTIRRGATRVDQRPIEELRPLLEAVIADEKIVEFGWDQYTPYFNDGEPCEFSVYAPWVRTTGDAEDAKTWNLEVQGHPTLEEDDPTWTKAEALGAAVEGGAFENVLLEAFGDHAQIVVRKDGITVEFYEHD